MANVHKTLSELFAAIADSIRGKTGSTAPIVADNFPSAISSIVTGIDTTINPAVAATSDDMREGVEAYANGAKVIGTLPLWKSIVWNTPTATFEDGQLCLKGNVGARRMLEKSSPATMWCAGDKLGNASADQVEEGKTFTSKDGLLVEGTMKVNGAHCWKRHAVRKNYDVIVENLGTTKPSDMGGTMRASYITTNDKYFQLSSETAYLYGYYLPIGQQNGQATYIYHGSFNAISGSTTYSKLTIGDSYSEEKGDFLKYVSSDYVVEHPIHGVGDDGYWYEYVVTDDITDKTFKSGTFTIGEGYDITIAPNHTFDIGLSNVDSIIVIKNSTLNLSDGYQFYWMYDGSKSFVGEMNSSGEKVIEESNNCISFADGTCKIGNIDSMTKFVLTNGTYSWIAYCTV